MVGYIVGVDIGGTFTDCAVLSPNGHVTIAKASSTPPAFADGALDALRSAACKLGYADEAGLLRDTRLLVHGCTVGDNAIYTASGAKTGLILTRGFADTLEMMRGDVVTGLNEEEAAHIAAVSKPTHIVPREYVHEVAERVDCRGDVLVPLDDDDVRAVVDRLSADGVKAVAVCLLWSFANRAHEERVKALLASARPDLFVSVSSEVVPFLGEYERATTTTFNAYIGPIVSAYLETLAVELAGRGLESKPLIMQSYGGALNVDAACKVPIGTVESGPVAGVMAAAAVGREVGSGTLLAIDMGGTTFKVGVVKGGQVEREANPPLLRYRLLWPKVWVESMGAGGGSIARVEARSGLLKVGPDGAGALPGPVCYGRGGTEPTVTDANLILGLLNADYFLGGEIKLDQLAAEEAISSKIGKPLGLDAVSAAQGVVRVIDAQMADLIKAATIRRGHDPRTMSLVAYGGAGPLHAVSLARQLGISQVVIPVTASVHSAYGLIMSDVARELGRTSHYTFPPERDAISADMADLVEEASRTLQADGFAPDRIVVECAVDMRYRYQVNEVTVPVDWAREKVAWDLDGLGDDFDALYAERYGKEAGYKEAGKEIVALRVRGVGIVERPDGVLASGGDRRPHERASSRTVYFPGTAGVESRIITIESLAVGDRVTGPAIIETPVTSIVLRPGDDAYLDAHGHVSIMVGLD